MITKHYELIKVERDSKTICCAMLSSKEINNIVLITPAEFAAIEKSFMLLHETSIPQRIPLGRLLSEVEKKL